MILNIKEGKSWTLSGREAEALHAEEEDEAEDSGDEDPIQVIKGSPGREIHVD